MPPKCREDDLRFQVRQAKADSSRANAEGYLNPATPLNQALTLEVCLEVAFDVRVHYSNGRPV